LNGQTGALKWNGVVTSGGAGGVGINAARGPLSAVADIDLDGDQEVAAGNTLYDYNGDVLWTYPYPVEAGHRDDGTNAIADFDADPQGEVVIVRRGWVYVLNHDGTLAWRNKIPKDDCANNESGPPTVADFDGDGQVEIGTAGADFYVVLDKECDADPVPGKCEGRGVLWKTPNQDCSSRMTASSVFDFEGDGKAEVVYADEQHFRVFDGTNGAILFEAPTSSNTRIEMPVIADVDNDGNSEIVVPSPSNGAAVSKGIRIFQDAEDNWVRTRRIWNQHGYSVTNITEDGRIPARPDVNWLNGRLNNYRQQIQPGGLFDAPDLAVESVGLGGVCAGAGAVQLTVTVSNRGALGEPAGVPVRVSVEHLGSVAEVGTVQTTQRLLPGQSEILTVPWTVPAGWWDDGFEVIAMIDPDTRVNECDELNNELGVDAASLATSRPGLNVTDLTIEDVGCGITRKITVSMTVSNTGAETVPANTPIGLEADSNGRNQSIATVFTQQALAPGDSESFEVAWDVTTEFYGFDFEVVATVDPQGEVFECTQKNTATATAHCIPEG
jgi:hypothetical protein